MCVCVVIPFIVDVRLVDVPAGVTRFSLSMEMIRLTRDGTTEPVSRDQNLRHARRQGNIHFPCSADHERDWQPYPFDPYSAICDDHTYIHTYIHRRKKRSHRVSPPSFCGACLIFSREKDSAVPFPRRP